jgi:SAM-dependent methyltransferase
MANDALSEAARTYADHRPRYPERLFYDLREHAIGGRGKHLVDWGCGTGELALPLSPFFDRVVAIDFHAAMLSVAREKARRAHVQNIEWVLGRAEDLELPPQSCDLIACGSAFHWMDRDLLVKRASQALKSGAALALVSGGGGGGVRKGDADWHRLVVECLKKHLDDRRPEPTQKRTDDRRSNAELLLQADFVVESFDYPTDFSWGIDDILGYLYSISFPPLHILGERREAFERDLRQALADANPRGVFDQRLDFNLLIGHKP